jgi:uncharacterized protein (TIGR03083 family)
MLTPVSEVPGLNGERARRAAAFQYAALGEELKRLDADQWGRQTECDRWDVHAVVAHLIGWMEALTSFKEFRHQLGSGWRRRDELGNILDAVNEVQVDDRRKLEPPALIARYEEMYPKLLALRSRFARVGRAIPFYDPVVAGNTNLAFYANVIFTRDAFMHRIDIAEAIGVKLDLSQEDGWVLADLVKDWSRRQKVDATVELESVGRFRAGSGSRASISGRGSDLARVLSGRADPSVLSLDGDIDSARRWLQAGCPF